MRYPLFPVAAMAIALSGCGNDSTIPLAAVTKAGSGSTTWAMVQPIVQAECVPCHSGFATQAGFALSASVAGGMVSSHAMPVPSSAQSAAMSDANRQTLINYCNGN